MVKLLVPAVYDVSGVSALGTDWLIEQESVSGSS
jgi:hypothetical protein